MLRTGGTRDFNELHLSTLSRPNSPTVLRKAGAKGGSAAQGTRGSAQRADNEVVCTLVHAIHVRERQPWALWDIHCLCCSSTQRYPPPQHCLNADLSKCLACGMQHPAGARTGLPDNNALRCQTPCVAAEGFFFLIGCVKCPASLGRSSGKKKSEQSLCQTSVRTAVPIPSAFFEKTTICSDHHLRQMPPSQCTVTALKPPKSD